MKQIALWKTEDGKYWLRLSEGDLGFCYQDNKGSVTFDYTSIERVLLRIKRDVLDYWPSKPIRHH